MSYKYSKGSQVIGDLKAADDTQRDTLIDFGEDTIDLKTSGSSVLKVSGSNVFFGDGTNLFLTGGAGIFFDSDLTRDVFIAELPTNNMLIDGNNRVFIRADQNVIVQHNTSVKADFDFGIPIVKIFMPISSSQPLSASSFHYSDSIKIIGAPAGQDTIVDNQGNFAGNSIDVGTVRGSNIVVTDATGGIEYKLPTTDGTPNQALTTDGAGTLTFSTISGGGGGGASVAGSNTEIQFNKLGALDADPDLTWNGTQLRAGGDLIIRDETIHEGYVVTKLPTNMSNTGSYANQKAFIKELFFTKYNWPFGVQVPLFSCEPHDERTGLPYTGTNIWAQVAVDITVNGHYRGVAQGNTVHRFIGMLEWNAGTNRVWHSGYSMMSAVNNDARGWFVATNTGTNGQTLNFSYAHQTSPHNGHAQFPGNATISIRVQAGYPVSDDTINHDARHIYWVFNSLFSGSSE